MHINKKCFVYRDLFLVIVFSLTQASCGLLLGGDQRVDSKSHDYTVVRLDHLNDTGEWLYKPKPKTSTGEISEEIADVAFEEQKSGSIISLNTVCGPSRPTDLHELMNTLLLGLKASSKLEYQDLTVDNSPALAATFALKNPAQNSTLVKAVVVQKNQCTFDFMLIANKSHYEKASSTFDRFLEGFKSNE